MDCNQLIRNHYKGTRASAKWKLNGILLVSNHRLASEIIETVHKKLLALLAVLIMHGSVHDKVNIMLN
uniref:Uncharacterized protein n=1 Tax=Romanomermis culicivorax TaxID=13658 RepID=A0A915KSW5_ROMCU